MDRRNNLPPQDYEALVRSQFRNLVRDSAYLIHLSQALGAINSHHEGVEQDKFDLVEDMVSVSARVKKYGRNDGERITYDGQKHIDPLEARFVGSVKYLVDKSNYSDTSIRSLVETMAGAVNDSFDRINRGIAVYSETH